MWHEEDKLIWESVRALYENPAAGQPVSTATKFAVGDNIEWIDPRGSQKYTGKITKVDLRKGTAQVSVWDKASNAHKTYDAQLKNLAKTAKSNIGSGPSHTPGSGESKDLQVNSEAIWKKADNPYKKDIKVRINDIKPAPDGKTNQAQITFYTAGLTAESSTETATTSGTESVGDSTQQASTGATAPGSGQVNTPVTGLQQTAEARRELYKPFFEIFVEKVLLKKLHEEQNVGDTKGTVIDPRFGSAGQLTRTFRWDGSQWLNVQNNSPATPEQAADLTSQVDGTQSKPGVESSTTPRTETRVVNLYELKPIKDKKTTIQRLQQADQFFSGAFV